MKKTLDSSVAADTLDSIRARIQAEERDRDRRLRRQRAAMLRGAIPTAAERMEAFERAMASALALAQADGFDLPINEDAIMGAVEGHMREAAHEIFWLWHHGEKLLRGKRCPTTDQSEEISALLSNARGEA
jgi:hypothetical protein